MVVAGRGACVRPFRSALIGRHGCNADLSGPANGNHSAGCRGPAGGERNGRSQLTTTGFAGRFFGS